MWKFAVHKPLFSEANISLQAHTSEIRVAQPYLKKSGVPPPPAHTQELYDNGKTTKALSAGMSILFLDLYMTKMLKL